MTDIGKKHKLLREEFFNQLAFLLAGAEWGKDLYKKAEEKCNFSENYYYILFPEGDTQIIEEFEEWQDQKMLGLLIKEEPKLKIREKISKALEARIISIVPKAIILRQNALFLLPCNLLLGAKCYNRTCDLIWRYAGDKSDDFNYYSKRGLLLCVYTAARLFYLSDDSKEFIKTKEFIATSLENIINVAKIKNKIKLPSMEDIPILRLMSW
jgi:ubiquinone biosynthesis protein COQ9